MHNVKSVGAYHSSQLAPTAALLQSARAKSCSAHPQSCNSPRMKPLGKEQEIPPGSNIVPVLYKVRSQADYSFEWRFLGKDGRPPPIWGIVKEFGPSDEDLRTRDMRRILGDVIRLQQLGIIYIDVADRQLIGGKFCDFSTAITAPHFVTTPELNPCLTPEWISAMEFETFQFSISDYWDFDEMVLLWNEEHENQKKISVHAFPDGRGCRIKYDLRSTPSRERVYSLVDPRLYDWRASAGSPENGATGSLDGRKSGRRTKGSSHGKPRGAISKTCRRLDPKPPRWYYDCNTQVAAKLKGKTSFSTSLEWEFKDGLIFPRKRK